MAVHGFWCHTKTFPLKCRFCGEQIYYFSCAHQSRVFFDELGWPWPIHRCGPAAPAADPGGGTSYAGPSGWGSAIGVNIFVDNPGSIDLLPGWRRGTDSVDPVLLKRVRGNGNPNREIMRLAPRGAQSVTAVGVVREFTPRPNLAKRYGLERGSIGYRQLARLLGDADPAQVTLFVDELDEDPAAIDYSGYTFLCRRELAGQGVRPGAVIAVRLAPQEVWGVDWFWVAQTLERLH